MQPHQDNRDKAFQLEKGNQTTCNREIKHHREHERDRNPSLTNEQTQHDARRQRNKLTLQLRHNSVGQNPIVGKKVN